MEFLVAAAIFLVFAAIQWLATGPALGGFNRAALSVFFGRRATRPGGWFKTDDRGVYVVQRVVAYVFLAAAVICAWIGILTLLIG